MKTKRILSKRLIISFLSFILAAGILNAANYYVDPATGNISNSGSEANPWSTLAEVFSTGKTFASGDVIYLKNGNHGWTTINQSNSGVVTIKSYPGHNPVINRLDFNGSSNWSIEGVRVYTSTAPPEAPVLEHPVYGKWGNYLVRLTNSSYVTFDNCYVYSIENSSSWTADDWNYKAWCGLNINTGCHHVTVKNSLFKNLNFSVDQSGANTSTIQYNTIQNYCGDALRVGTGNVIEYNKILDSYDTNGNHDDAMQAFASSDAVVRGNTIINVTSASRSFISYSTQGIGFFDGFFNNYVVENNLVVIHHWHGISLYGANNCKIANNTVVYNPIGSSTYGPPWISIFAHKNGTAGTGNTMINNLTSDVGSTVGTSVSNNIETTSYTSQFVDYTGLDFRLKSSSSAVNAGTTSSAPTIDLNQYPRSGNPDVGCYELGSVASGGDTEDPSTPTGLASGTVTENSIALSWNASTDNVGVTGYKVYTNGSNPVTVAGTSTTISGLSASTQYSFTVSAVDAASNESSQSSALQVTTATATSATNLALGKSVTVSSEPQPENGAGNLVDDNTADASRWSASGFPQWAVIDLGQNFDVSSIEVFTYQSRAYQYIVEAMPSGGSYSTIINRSSNTQTAQPIADNVSVTARYVRITVSGASGYTGSWVSLTEVKVMGTVGGGSDTQAPSVPTGLSAGTVTTSSVALSWNSSTDNVGVTGYKVYTNGSNPVTVGGTSTTISGLSASTQYSFTVSAVDAASNESAQSSALQVTTATPPDTQAPSVPTGLSAGTVTTSSVALSWNSSTDNVGVTGYKVYTNGSNPITVGVTSTTISGLSASTQYSFTVSAIDAASNESSQSSALNVTTSSTAVTSSSTWQTFGLSTQTGTFTATFDAVPDGSNVDALTGILNGTATGYSSLACIIRFNSSGQIDARNGGSYTASNTVNYSSGISYHFRVEINVSSHTYSVYVTPQGSSEQTVASNFAFRSEQSSVSQLNGWAVYAYIGSHSVSNMAFTSGSSANATLASAAEQTVKLYPNPLTGGMLHINLTGYTSDMVNVNVYDLAGRSVYNQQYVNQTNIQIPANELNSGIYIVTLKSDGITRQQKLIVE